MLPIGSTTIPEVEEGSELFTLNVAQVIDVETHRHRGNRKSKNAVSQLKHFEILSEPTKGSLEKMTNRNRIQLEDASTEGNHQPKGRPQTRASRANRSFQGIPEGFRSYGGCASVFVWWLRYSRLRAVTASSLQCSCDGCAAVFVRWLCRTTLALHLPRRAEACTTVN
jgi:hypothetical protein